MAYLFLYPVALILQLLPTTSVLEVVVSLDASVMARSLDQATTLTRVYTARFLFPHLKNFPRSNVKTMDHGCPLESCMELFRVRC